MPHPNVSRLAIGAAFVASAALGADSGSQDWPCVQRKVTQLTSAQFWDGPQVDGLSRWQDNAAIDKLIPVLVSRRVPIEDAAAAIGRFAAEQPQDKSRRDAKAAFCRVACHREQRAPPRHQRH